MSNEPKGKILPASAKFEVKGGLKTDLEWHPYRKFDVDGLKKIVEAKEVFKEGEELTPVMWGLLVDALNGISFSEFEARTDRDKEGPKTR